MDAGDLIAKGLGIGVCSLAEAVAAEATAGTCATTAEVDVDGVVTGCAVAAGELAPFSLVNKV